MTSGRPSIVTVAQDIDESLKRHDESEARRLAFHFVERFDTAHDDELDPSVIDEAVAAARRL